MLLARGILLVLLTVTSAANCNPEVNVFVLFIFTASLLFFMSVKYIYKRTNVRILESATLLNLVILSAGTLYKWESTESKWIVIEVSIGITFTQFCIILVWGLIKPCHSACASWRRGQNQRYDVVDENTEDDITHERIEDSELEPLISCASQPVIMPASAKYTVTVTKVRS